MQFSISVPAVGMFCINTHACRELTCWLHMNHPNLHNAKLLLTVAECLVVPRSYTLL